MDNTINSLVSKAVGFTDQQVKDYFLSNPNMSDAQIFGAMKTFGVSPNQVASATGTPLKNIISRLTPFLPQNEAVLLGDTWVQGNYRTSGSGETLETGPLESVAIYKTPGGQNDKIPVGTDIQTYSPSGDFINTIQSKKDLSFFGGIKEALKDPMVQAAILGVAGGAGAFDGLLSGTGTAAGTTAGTAGTAAGGSTLGSLGTVGSAGTAGLMGTGTGLTAAGAGGLGGATGAAGLGGGLGTGLTAAGAGGLGGAAGAAGLGGGLGAGLTTAGGLAAGNSLLGGAALGSTLGSIGTGVLGSAAGTAAGSALGSTLGSSLAGTAGSALGTSLGTGLGLSAIGNLAGTAANAEAIADARNLINQYGGIANTQLNTAYKDAQGLGAANRTDLGNVYSNASTVLNNLYNQQVGYQQPYQDIGALGESGFTTNKDYLTRQFTNADLTANLAPNYAFQLAQGQMANQRAANMGGGSLGGNALQGLQRYTQDYAGNAYQNAFNNFNTQRQNIYGNLADMAKIGTTSAGQLANLGSSLGGVYGNLSSGYGSNLTAGAGQGMNAANVYGLNSANLATGLGSALANNAVAGGANTAGALSNLGNTALLGSLIKAT